MSFVETFRAVLRLARVALASILLVGVPLAEAATCAGEDFAAASEFSIAVADGALLASADDSVGGDDHGSQPAGDAHCIHGHCHHSTPFKDSERVAPVVAESSAIAQSLVSDGVITRVSAGPERPPKA
jgi:hypothetical protein